MGRVKWTYDTCKEEASKYKTRTNFKEKSQRAYTVSRKNGWINEWFGIVSTCKWTYEVCKYESEKYSSYSEFNSGNYLAYRKAKEKGWLSNFTWLVNDIGFYDTTTKMYSVYKYEWRETNSIYIGLTKNILERDRGHRKIIKKNGKDYKSSVKIYSEKNNLEIPPLEVIEKNLNAIDARERENYWVVYYKENGFNVINKGKTGKNCGSLGGCIKKWSYDLCYKEAKKYKTRTDFQNALPGAYRVARKSGWIKEYTWMPPQIHPNGYWNYDRCFDEAKQYEYWNDFIKKSHSAYDSAKRNNWLNDYIWLKQKSKPNGYWNYDRCFEEGKKYSSIKEFRKQSNYIYAIAMRKKFIEQIKKDLCWK